MTCNGQLSVPPGFRFHPTDEELLHYYLRKKVSYEPIDLDVIREIDLNKLEPWDLKEKCMVGSGPQNEWYFFSHKDKKYPTGTRTNRATVAGFWKATGRDKAIHLSSSRRIGMRKTLVFYTGRAPHGQKTDWIMHEYRLEEDNFTQIHEDGWVVCRVFKKKNHTRGFHPEFDHDEVSPPFDVAAAATAGIPEQKHDSNSNHLPPYNYTFVHNTSMHLPQLLSPDTAPPPPLLGSLPFPAVDSHCPESLLRLTSAGTSGDWSFLDKLLATHQAMDQFNKGQQLLSQSEVADLVPNQRLPFYYSGFEQDLSRYSK